MRVLLLWIVCLGTLGSCMAQQFKDRATHTVDVSQLDRFHLYNRRGAVTVKTTSGTTATLQVTRSLKAKSQQKLEEAKGEIYLDKLEKDGQVVFFIQHPDLRLEEHENGHFYYNNRKNGSWWNEDEKDRIEAEFTIVLEIPARTNLSVVNHQHPLKVNGMQADLYARNHHDGVLVENQGGSADVYSHHGNVEVFYTKNPTRDCKYDTHHGDIRVHYQRGLSANASMYSYHGSFFSAFDWTLSPISVAKTDGKGKGKYRISRKSGTNVSIGNGGPVQSFKTHHGDIYLLDK